METQLVYHRLRQWEPSFGIRPDKPSDLLLPHHDAEPTFPIHHDAVLTLIGCASEVRQIYGDGLATLCLTAQSIYPTRSLFDRAGIPRKIVMNDMTAASLKVHALAHDFTAHKDIREERRIECPHEP